IGRHRNGAVPAAAGPPATPAPATALPTAPASTPTAVPAPLPAANPVATPQSPHTAAATLPAATLLPYRRRHTNSPTPAGRRPSTNRLRRCGAWLPPAPALHLPTATTKLAAAVLPADQTAAALPRPPRAAPPTPPLLARANRRVAAPLLRPRLSPAPPLPR